MLAAVRRRWWLIGVLVIVGALAGTLLSGSSTPTYQAVAKLLVQPRTSANGISSSNDPERYIAGEVAFLDGTAVADKVAAKVPGSTAEALLGLVSIEHKTNTDVVDVIVRSQDAAFSQTVANVYAEVYIAESEARTTDSYKADIADIDQRLKDLSDKINAIEVERAKITPNSTNVADRTRDAQLFEQTSQYRSQYTQLLATQTNLQYASTLKSRSEVLQLAVLPTAPQSSSRLLLIGAGGFVGAVLAAVAAVAWAASSRWLLDGMQLEEILGAQVVGTLPRRRELAGGPRTAFERLPDATAAVIDQLCVRAEASAQGETDALAIAVVGAQRGAGVSTVALAMAGRFARNGARTVVIDADLADPAISRAFDATHDAGLPGLLARLAAARQEPPVPGAPAPLPPEAFPSRVFTPTSIEDVRILGVGAPVKARSLHRTNVDTVIAAASRGGVDVVVIDGGPLLDAATTVRLCQVVDVVVLVVPQKQQLIEPLGVINRLLGYRSGDLLPVLTAMKPKPAASVVAPSPSADDLAVIDELMEPSARWRARQDGRAATALAVPPRAAPPSSGPTPPARAAATSSLPPSPRLGAPPRRSRLLEEMRVDEIDEWVAREPEDRSGS